MVVVKAIHTLDNNKINIIFPADQRWKQVIGILCVIVLIMLKLELGLFWLLARECEPQFTLILCSACQYVIVLLS